VEQATEGLDLDRALGALVRRAPLIVLCAVLAAVVAFGLSEHQAKKYTTTAALAFSNNPLSQQIAGLAPTSSTSLLAQQANDVELVRLGETPARTAGVLGHGLTAEKVASSLSISGQGESGVVSVSATATSPTLAAEIANTYVTQFVKQQRIATRRYFTSALTLVKGQLAALTPTQRVGADGLELQDRAQTLALLSELQYGNVQLAQEAALPTSPSSPKTSRNTLIGGALGLLLGLALAFVLEQLDWRVRRPQDLESIYRAQLLGSVPESRALSAPDRQGGDAHALLTPTVAEAFGLIRAHLRFLNVDRELRAILIASACPGEGKTTIARHLAEAAARAGTRVLLLELDLRQPTLAEQLDLSSTDGLADVLTGAVTVDEAIQSAALDTPRGDGSSDPALDVLAAGSVLPPNPGELIESRAMISLLEHLRSAYEMIVIDTPPLSAVSDAFSLLAEVDGVVLVGRIGHSRRDAMEQLHQILAGSSVPLLGVIANGAKSSEPAAYASHHDSATVVSANGAAPSTAFEPTAGT
jgi:polysaccharide biosynthesis transport protein